MCSGSTLQLIVSLVNNSTTQKEKIWRKEETNSGIVIVVMDDDDIAFMQKDRDPKHSFSFNIFYFWYRNFH